MPSRFIHVGWCTRVFFLSKAKSYSVACTDGMLLIYPPARNPGVPSTSGLLWSFNCSESGHKSTPSFLSGCQIAGSHSNLIFSFLSTQRSIFHSSCITFYLCPLPLQHTAFQLPHILTSTCYFLFLIFYFILFFVVVVLSPLRSDKFTPRGFGLCFSRERWQASLQVPIDHVYMAFGEVSTRVKILDCVLTHLYWFELAQL